jgi:hypothetical protein
MGADEEGTLARLKAHRRELIDPKISEHRGRIVKTTGDGTLVEFLSVVDAVRCAVAVQQAMPEVDLPDVGDWWVLRYDERRQSHIPREPPGPVTGKAMTDGRDEVIPLRAHISLVRRRRASQARWISR